MTLPSWLLAIFATALLSVCWGGVTTWAKTNDNAQHIEVQDQRIGALENAVSQIKADVAAAKADGRATRATSADTNAKINILIDKALSK